MTRLLETLWLPGLEHCIYGFHRKSLLTYDLEHSLLGIFWESSKGSDEEHIFPIGGGHQGTRLGALLKNTGIAAVPTPAPPHLVTELSFLEEPSLSDDPGGLSHLSDSCFTALCHGPPRPGIGHGQEYELFIMGRRSERIKGWQSGRWVHWTAQRKSSRLG